MRPLTAHIRGGRKRLWTDSWAHGVVALEERQSLPMRFKALHLNITTMLKLELSVNYDLSQTPENTVAARQAGGRELASKPKMIKF